MSTLSARTQIRSRSFNAIGWIYKLNKFIQGHPSHIEHIKQTVCVNSQRLADSSSQHFIDEKYKFNII